jgi:hypothetical protein
MNLIRAKTMKQGGPGYMQSRTATNSFPALADVQLASRWPAERLPTVAWLDGTSDWRAGHGRAMPGGRAQRSLPPSTSFRTVTSHRVCKDQKLKNLYEVMALAEQLHWPVIAGTEMNSPGQKFVDNSMRRNCAR